VAKKRKRKPFTPLVQRESKFVITEGMLRTMTLPSKSTIITKDKALATSSMDPEEYRIREEAAQKEIDRKKTMVAPLYNKGSYQYIGDAPPEVIKNLGRKT
jgi:hypothetical protein